LKFRANRTQTTDADQITENPTDCNTHHYEHLPNLGLDGRVQKPGNTQTEFKSGNTQTEYEPGTQRLDLNNCQTETTQVN